MSDLKFFELTRAQIQHEDLLINNRVTWLLALQAFLFAAYGFSLGAQATLQSAQNSLRIAVLNTPVGVKSEPPIDLSKVNDWSKEIADAMIFISQARLGFAIMSFLSSAVLLMGIASAAISMTTLVKIWKDRKVKNYPQIIGTIPILGSYGGLFPTYFLPIATSGVWYWLGRNEPDPSASIMQWGLEVVIIIAVLGLVFLAGVRYARTKDVSP